MWGNYEKDVEAIQEIYGPLQNAVQKKKRNTLEQAIRDAFSCVKPGGRFVYPLGRQLVRADVVRILEVSEAKIKDETWASPGNVMTKENPFLPKATTDQDVCYADHKKLEWLIISR